MTQTPSTIVYSCTFADYDYTFGPVVDTPGARFIRFGDTRPNRWRIWNHQPIPSDQVLATQTLTNRRFKFFPKEVLPPCDVAVYLDGNILVRGDLTPLIRTFWDSGADIALFPHPSGRTLAEEIDFALEKRIPPQDLSKTMIQRDRYAAHGLLHVPITENSILFYRMSSPLIAEIGPLLWDELDRFSKRDQISLPYVLNRLTPKVHLWNFHFHHPSKRNTYFLRTSHRSQKPLKRFQQAAYFLKDYSIGHRWAYRSLKVAGGVRRASTWIEKRLKGAF